MVPDLAAALRRVEDHCLPLESVRAQKAYGQPSAVNRLLILNAEPYPGRSASCCSAKPSDSDTTRRADMTTSNPQQSVLLIGASQRILDDSVAALRDLGYTAQATNDFFSDITGRFDVTPNRPGLAGRAGPP